MAAINRKTAGALDLANEISRETLQLIHYFASDTTKKILEHIDSLHIKDTGALRNSIRAVVTANAGGKGALVSFYMAEYAPYVEQAVGKYWGVDADLKEARGVAHENIHAPQSGYPPEALTASFDGLPYRSMGPHAKPHDYHDALREKTHKPRQFMRREIARQVERISYRLLADVGNTMEIHMLETVADALDPLKQKNLYRQAGYNIVTWDSDNMDMDTMDF